MTGARLVALCSSDRWAGNEKWVLRACEALAERGREVTLVARRPEVFAPRRRADLPLLRVRMGGQADLPAILRLAALFRRRADVVLLTRVRDYWLGGLAARLAGVPVLLRLGVVRRLRDRYLPDRLRYGVLPAALIVNAAAIRDTLLRTPWIREDRIHVIPNGVDAPGPLPDDERTALRGEMGAAEGDLLVAGAGRLDREKRWDWLLRGVAALRNEGIPAKACLMGEGSERAALEELIDRLHLSGVVQLPGWLPGADRRLAAADIVALPSANEGLANVLLEAMGHGVPVVATDAGGTSEVFTDDREMLIAPVEDEKAFHARLLRAAGDPGLRARLGAAGLAAVRERFTWSAMAGALGELVDKLGKQR